MINQSTNTEKTIISIIKSPSIRKKQLLQLHAHLIYTSFIQNPTVSFSLLSRLLSSLSFDLAYSRQIFDQVKKPNVSHYNAIIRAYSMSINPVEGFVLFREMLRKNVRPDSMTCSFVTKACVKGSSLFGGLQIHGWVLRAGCHSDCLLMTGLMDFYSSFRVVGDACKVFDEIARRDTVVWNVLISCCMRNGRTRDALDVFDRMERAECGSRPDDVTCLLVLQACSNLGVIEFGERVHNYVREHGYEKMKNVSNSLIAMYSRCGEMEKAYEVFKGMDNKSVVSWSAMISGLASNGFGREAIEAFGDMQKTGVMPDEQTFTGVLSACSRSGLLDEGRVFFNSMSKDFGITPNIHHYGCVVDLMGRAGLLEEAYNLILSMSIKPDAALWRTLLGACKVHGHAELGERVVGQVIELKAWKAGDYLLLLNIYSSAGDHEKVSEVRRLMRVKGIRTTPASCTIELKGDVHSFVADDILHPRKKEIYDTLEEIEKQLKIAGYVTEITTELHNVDAAGNQFRFSYHSEKLAIAFGVLATPPGTKIRVAKNLRTCADCHKFAEIFSGVYNREVVIRDRACFHHFREGHCSCNGYW
ncbi:hypothetical protein DCAR_0729924 [Daucus carota subsp. sativus]|uniref:DYW domain-containing protein n=2 Tax=Daucus carota subsp. sativus TaxID=79200 RepID=A0AAF0XLQ8_DAUCS|nr:hypothetical protein DCAR_0729924 [Daucus carota subsp. sativus]